MTENAIGPARVVGAKTVKVDRAAAAVMASMADATAGMATLSELAAAADLAKPRPKANLDAKNIKDVYTIDNLIGEDVFKSIGVLEWQESAKKNKEVIVGSRFVASRIVRCSENIEKLKILRFLLYLIDFYNSSKSGRSKARKLASKAETRLALGNAPEQVSEDIKRRFSTGGEISGFQADLLITHCAALACLIDNYDVDMFDLRQDLNVEARQMQQYFQEIGAKMAVLPEAQRKALGLDKAAASQRKIAKLKLPLEFPKVSFGRKLR